MNVVDASGTLTEPGIVLDQLASRRVTTFIHRS